VAPETRHEEDDARVDANAPRPDQIAAVLRLFVARSGAARATALIDRDPEPPVLVDCEEDGATEMVEGESVRHLASAPEDEEVAAAVPDVRRLPPPAVDLARGEVVAPVGAVAHLATAVRGLAERLPGRSVLTVQFPTQEGEALLSVAARTGEPLVLALGDEQFPMPPDWP